VNVLSRANTTVPFNLLTQRGALFGPQSERDRNLRLDVDESTSIESNGIGWHNIFRQFYQHKF